MNKTLKFATILGLASISIASCKKEEVKPNTSVEVTPQAVIQSIAQNVNSAIYADLAQISENLYGAVLVFSTNLTAENLENCRSLWKSARSTWEQSEGFIYGPVATENIDPRIDTWPVNFVDLNAQIAGSNEFTDTYVDNLEDALKGFHPIEFLLWGETGSKTVNQFTAREIEYLVALTKNLKVLTSELAVEWNVTQQNAYITHFVNPASSNVYYGTKKDVFLEIVNAMIGICEEVAAGKIGEPFINQDPSLEESPYSQNSMIDFTNNVRSVQNIYLGKFNTDGLGIEDLVRKYNLSMDNAIKAKINAAILAMNNITVPFGQAITDQPTQVQNAIAAMEELKGTLETQLLPFVNQYITD